MPCSLYLLIIQEVCLKNNPLIGKSIKFSLFFLVENWMVVTVFAIKISIIYLSLTMAIKHI